MRPGRPSGGRRSLRAGVWPPASASCDVWVASWLPCRALTQRPECFLCYVGHRPIARSISHFSKRKILSRKRTRFKTTELSHLAHLVGSCLPEGSSSYDYTHNIQRCGSFRQLLVLVCPPLGRPQPPALRATSAPLTRGCPCPPAGSVSCCSWAVTTRSGDLSGCLWVMARGVPGGHPSVLRVTLTAGGLASLRWSAEPCPLPGRRASPG